MQSLVLVNAATIVSYAAAVVVNVVVAVVLVVVLDLRKKAKTDFMDMCMLYTLILR